GGGAAGGRGGEGGGGGGGGAGCPRRLRVEKAGGRAGVVRSRRSGGGSCSRRGLAPPDRGSRRGAAGFASEGAQPSRAARGHGSGALLVSRSVPTAAGRRRLSQDRARVPHGPARSYRGDGLRAAQRGQALHHPDRYLLRPRG